MALPGMKSTADYATDERPKNWREGILLLEPRNKAPLASLTAAMPEQSTDDPEFNWWEESVDVGQLVVNGAQTNVDTALEIDEFGLRLKAGDMLRVKSSGEAVRVTAVTSDTAVTIARGQAGTAAAVINDNDVLLYIGSAYREGAGRPTGVSWNPTKKYNLTQIFRDAIEWTRTNSKTRMRTGDQVKNDRRRALNKHMIGMERAFIFGARFETTESNQPLRYTGGILSFIDAANQVNHNGTLSLKQLEDYIDEIFAYGSNEKLCFCSLATMMKLNRLIRKNTDYQWGPSEREFSMVVKRFHTPGGTLILTEHPLFSQTGAELGSDLLIIDTPNLKYRYITDTVLLKDRQDKGVDGTADEYLTECGLEFHHPKTHFWLKNITDGVVDA
jgi:hypothetical protein